MGYYRNKLFAVASLLFVLAFALFTSSSASEQAEQAEQEELFAASRGRSARQEHHTETSQSEIGTIKTVTGEETPPSLVYVADLEWHEKRKTQTWDPDNKAKAVNDALLALGRALSARAGSQAAAQERLSKLSADFADASQNVGRLKARADAIDEQLLTCRAREKERLRDIDSDAAALQEEHESKENVCKQLGDVSSFAWSLRKTNGTCDFSSNDPCGSVDSLVAEVRDMRSRVNEVHGKFLSSGPPCKEAQASFLESVLARAQLAKDIIREEGGLRDNCDSVQTTAHNAMCAFGVHLQNMCALKKVALALKSEVSDRDNELSSLGGVKCWLLSQHPNGTDGCRTPSLDGFEFAGASPFACDERSVAFSSYVWRTGVTSADYVKEVYSPALTLEPGTAPFDFCASDEAGDSAAVLKSPAQAARAKS